MKTLFTEYPLLFAQEPSHLTREEKIASIAQRFSEILEILGLDPSSPPLAATPQRVAQMYVEEFFFGLDPASFPSIQYLDNPCKPTETPPLILLHTSFHSCCEHHFVPIEGTAYIGYLPKEKYVGFSCIAKVVRFFAARPQIQERLNAQIVDALSLILETEDIAVSLVARHSCMTLRGVQDKTSQVTTHVLRGEFEKNTTHRHAFFHSFTQGSVAY
jgi:GTP cyclohydrolase I